MVKEYTPKAGDIIRLSVSGEMITTFCITPEEYNQVTGYALFCPITEKSTGYPFEIPLENCKTNGFILSDRVRSICWKKAACEASETASSAILEAVTNNIKLLLP